MSDRSAPAAGLSAHRQYFVWVPRFLHKMEARLSSEPHHRAPEGAFQFAPFLQGPANATD